MCAWQHYYKPQRAESIFSAQIFRRKHSFLVLCQYCEQSSLVLDSQQNLRAYSSPRKQRAHSCQYPEVPRTLGWTQDLREEGSISLPYLFFWKGIQCVTLQLLHKDTSLQFHQKLGAFIAKQLQRWLFFYRLCMNRHLNSELLFFFFNSRTEGRTRSHNASFCHYLPNHYERTSKKKKKKAGVEKVTVTSERPIPESTISSKNSINFSRLRA